MHGENKRRFILFLCVAVFHAVLLFAVVLRMETVKKEEEKRAEIMKLVDIEEEPVRPPPPQAPPPPRTPPPLAVTSATDAVAENMIASDEAPPPAAAPNTAPVSDDTYLPAHKISSPPSFPEDEIRKATIYPPIALRSGIEGTVILELFVDSQGYVRDIKVLQEKPEGRGFGEAAVRAFTGKRGKPAQAKTEGASAENVPVAARYRYPVRFRIK